LLENLHFVSANSIFVLEFGFPISNKVLLTSWLQIVFLLGERHQTLAQQKPKEEKEK
jgi:hypothetical protein